MRIKEYFSQIKKSIGLINKTADLSYENSVDLISANQLFSLFKELPYLPVTDSSLRFSSLTYFLNDIVINKRKCIIEFGAGISTICLAKLIKQLGLKDVSVISIDNNKEWLDIVKSYISDDIHGLDFRFIQAELRECHVALDNNKWYDVKILKELENYKGKIDSVLVDGPEAWSKEIALSRYPAVPFLADYFSDNFSVFLDDTNRQGEQLIQEMWQNKFDLKLQRLSTSFSRLYKGPSFNIK